jgi:Ca-activated chloride channel family protein
MQLTLTHPQWLWALIALLPLVLLEWRAARRAERALEALVGKREEHRLLEQRRVGQRRAGALLRLGALACLILGAAGPEWGREVVRRAATGSDIVFLIDVSASMDARDVAPSRLDEARREALSVLDRLEGSRVAVVAFAGDAVRICPLTLERSAVRLALEGLSSASVSLPGTDLGRGLETALKVMPAGRRDEQAIMLWTDGEDLEEGAGSAIDMVANANVRVFAVGCGTPAGDVVPVLDREGRAVDVKRDDAGGPVMSRLDEALLRTIARRTHGGYFSANRPGGELPRLVGALGSVARAARGERLIERPVARFPLFAALAVLLLAVEVMRARRAVRRRASASGTAPGPVTAPAPIGAVTAFAVTCALTLGTAGLAEAQSAWARGDAAFRAGRHAEAESLYAKRLAKGGPDAVRVNLATARALAGRDGAEAPLADLARTDQPAGRAAGYNLGTLLGGRNEFDPALAELRRTLERDPADADARWNYEVLLRRRAEAERKLDSRPDDAEPEREDPQPEPRPSPSAPSQGPPPPQGGQSPAPEPQSSGQNPPPRGTQGMDRAQAERLLGALEELQRLERQRQQRVRVMQEKRGKDW